MSSQTQISPGKLSMIPLFYIGWSDSVLSPSEMKLIHQKLAKLDFLTEDDKEYLIRWTDPTNPPSDEIFKEWSNIIRSHKSLLSQDQLKSLSELGLELARNATNYRSDEIWKAPKTKAALLEIEESMGIHNSESLRMAIGQSQNESASNTSASFDVESLRRYLDGTHIEIKERIRKLLRDPVFAYANIVEKDAFRKHTLDLVKKFGQQGIGGYAFPKKYGGQEVPGGHIAAFESVAFSDLSLTVKFGVQFGLFGGAVYGLGTEKHFEKYIEPMCKAELLGCFAMTETGHGSNVKGLETTAVYDHHSQSFIINSPDEDSGKEYIGNALHAHLAAVFAQLIVDDVNHGVHCFVVPMRNSSGELQPGIRVEDCGYKMGLNGVDNGRIWFNNVSIPKDNLLNKYGDVNESGEYVSSINSVNRRFFTMLGALVAGRICVGLGGISASKSALSIAIKYGLKRRQFASKSGDDEMLIMDYPTHQRRLIPRLAKTYGYHFALSELADQYVSADTEEAQRKIETKAAGLKAMATWHATDTIQECREACGGKGYLSENRFTDLKADTDIFTTFEGDNTVLLQLVAKGVMTEFRESFHSDGVRAVIKYIGTRFSNTLTEYNPFFRRNTNAEHLLDAEFHKEAFQYRKEKMLHSLSNRMRNFLNRRIPLHEAFLKCQIHMVDMARAYVDYQVLKSFQRAVVNCNLEKERALLEKLKALYALTILEEEKGWFLENDFMDGTKSKAVRRMINKLCQELRPDINGLVDAFGIPEELLGAKIVI